ncbi:ABC transporter substrate-binding protein [Chloroflexota bacterium]
MTKKILWMVVSGLMVLSLVMAACGPADVEEKEEDVKEEEEKEVGEKEKDEEVIVEEEVVSSDKPQYGGTLTFAQSGDQRNWGPIRNITGRYIGSLYQQLWEGDWSRGNAGGYGTGECDWGMGNNDLFEYKMGFIAENTDWTFSVEDGYGTIVYQIRPGVTYGLNPDLEASRLVGGREVTADDVVYVLKRAITETFAYIYRTNIELREAVIEKTGPMEVSVTLPLGALYTGIIRFGDSVFFYPPEVVEEYGSMDTWKEAVGTGPFVITDSVSGSIIKMERSENYWLKNPIGPGKGDALPYIDTFRILIIPDLSTRLAALRTGKVDRMGGLYDEDAAQLRESTPELIELTYTSAHGRGSPALMRTDRAPFDDIRVRKAMNLAVDNQAILDGLYDGVGQINTYPCSKITPYDVLYLDLDAPDFPEEAKELYGYNPEKAKQLLAEAGYPDGFKTEILLTTTQVDYYSIIADYLSKVGIEMILDVKESGTVTAMHEKKEHKAIGIATTGPIAQFTSGFTIHGVSRYNLAMIDDPVINDAMDEVRLTALTDQNEAMLKFREVTKYVVQQAYGIPNAIGPRFIQYWPWIRNYSGEEAIGYDDYTWHQYIWLDQEMKKSMGY